MHESIKLSICLQEANTLHNRSGFLDCCLLALWPLSNAKMCESTSSILCSLDWHSSWWLCLPWAYLDFGGVDVVVIGLFDLVECVWWLRMTIALLSWWLWVQIFSLSCRDLVKQVLSWSSIRNSFQSIDLLLYLVVFWIDLSLIDDLHLLISWW